MLLKLIIPLFSLLLFVQCSSVGTKVVAKTEKGLKDGVYQIDARKYVLPNGMTLILSKNPKLPIFSIYTFYKVGSKHEGKGLTGASHYLEHMMFKGAKKFGKGRFDKIIESNGGSSNAYTNYDGTVYYENLPTNALETILDLESDRMQNLLLEPTDFNNEKNVVLEERKMRYENSPRGQLYIGVMNRIFKGTPYEVPVIGTKDDIKNYSREQIFDYFKKFYAPNNAIMLIVGDIDYDNTLGLVTEYFSEIPQSPNVVETKQKMERGFENKIKKNKSEHFYGKSENPLFVLAFPGLKYGSRKSYVGDILASILAGNRSSFLNKKYVENNNPRLTSISASNYTLQNSGIFFLMGEMIKGAGVRSFKNNLLGDLKRFCNSKIDDRSVQKIKNQYLIQFYNELETNAGVANYLGTIESYTGNFANYINEIKTYQSITTKEVKEACDDFVLAKNHYYMTVWKNNKKKLNI